MTRYPAGGATALAGAALAVAVAASPARAEPVFDLFTGPSDTSADLDETTRHIVGGITVAIP